MQARGFAVVAHEVKELAKQTAKATEEIINQVTRIQTDAQESVSAIVKISETIKNISQKQTNISDAVDLQAKGCRDIVQHAESSDKRVQVFAKLLGVVADKAKCNNRQCTKRRRNGF